MQPVTAGHMYSKCLMETILVYNSGLHCKVKRWLLVHLLYMLVSVHIHIYTVLGMLRGAFC